MQAEQDTSFYLRGFSEKPNKIKNKKENHDGKNEKYKKILKIIFYFEELRGKLLRKTEEKPTCELNDHVLEG